MSPVAGCPTEFMWEQPARKAESTRPSKQAVGDHLLVQTWRESCATLVQLYGA